MSKIINKWTICIASVVAPLIGVGIGYYTSSRILEDNSLNVSQESSDNEIVRYLVHDTKIGKSRYIDSDLRVAEENINRKYDARILEVNARSEEKMSEIKRRHDLERRLKERDARREEREESFRMKLESLDCDNKAFNKSSDYYRKFMKEIREVEKWMEENEI